MVYNRIVETCEGGIGLDDRFTPDQQSIVSFSLMGPESGGPCLVESKDERITRIRPYHYDKEYTDCFDKALIAFGVFYANKNSQ